MKDWENNIVSYTMNKAPDKCPKCGSTDIKVEEHRFEHRYSVSFLCRVCGSGDHFDGFAETSNREKTSL